MTAQQPKIQPHRQIILDTETTGMQQYGEHYQGHCIIEIGAVEVINRRRTGRELHLYIKPDRPVDPEAQKVHGISDADLADKPSFPEIAQEFIDFIKGAELVIHNAPFDVGFMDYEFRKHKLGVQTADICTVLDTLALARQMYPGKRNSLDALCTRLNIDNSKRTLHGALLDAEILADVYLTMTGGQTNLFDDEDANILTDSNSIQTISRSHLPKEDGLRVINANNEEQKHHYDFLQLVNKKSQNHCFWLLDDAEIVQDVH